MVRGQRHLDVITDAPFAEQALQLPHRQWQQFEQCQQYVPLFVNVSWLRQAANTRQDFMQVRHVAQLIDQRVQGFLLAFVTGREAVVLVDTLSPVAAFCQQESADCLPRNAIARSPARQFVAAGQFAQRMVRFLAFMQIVDGVTDQGEKFRRTVFRE